MARLLIPRFTFTLRAKRSAASSKRREPEQVERDEFGRRKWPEEKIPIDFEPVPGFNLRAQVVGHGGLIDEDMYLHVAGPDPNEVQKAKELCEDLLKNVREQYEEFKARPPHSWLLAAKIPAMEESEATVIALQTDPGLMADTITMSTYMAAMAQYQQQQQGAPGSGPPPPPSEAPPPPPGGSAPLHHQVHRQE
ncbi:hypothetical protein EYC84_005819 [Monilinia fructicola]|uniref:Uncharacterized protein n=1 Tax=Monilinia fructicola TaxID=38448 RepID=A0A5M9K2X0_MONFR|nr:hypothetical protein EYC84_005819 [Monilinia fructicola]